MILALVINLIIAVFAVVALIDTYEKLTAAKIRIVELEQGQRVQMDVDTLREMLQEVINEYLDRPLERAK